MSIDQPYGYGGSHLPLKMVVARQQPKDPNLYICKKNEQLESIHNISYIADLDTKYTVLGTVNPNLRMTLYSSDIDISQSHV